MGAVVTAEDGTSDFVRKLYKCVFIRKSFLELMSIRVCRMLEDQMYHSVISWGSQGDCFVVKVRGYFSSPLLPVFIRY